MKSFPKVRLTHTAVINSVGFFFSYNLFISDSFISLRGHKVTKLTHNLWVCLAKMSSLFTNVLTRSINKCSPHKDTCVRTRTHTQSGPRCLEVPPKHLHLLLGQLQQGKKERVLQVTALNNYKKHTWRRKKTWILP